jgi:hypothetical protein
MTEDRTAVPGYRNCSSNSNQNVKRAVIVANRGYTLARQYKQHNQAHHSCTVLRKNVRVMKHFKIAIEFFSLLSLF